jgi:hypothetical protein
MLNDNNPNEYDKRVRSTVGDLKYRVVKVSRTVKWRAVEVSMTVEWEV